MFMQYNGRGTLREALSPRHIINHWFLVGNLKYEHVYLTSFSKMRVDLAAQVC